MPAHPKRVTGKVTVKLNALTALQAKNGTGMLGDGQGLWLVKATKERGKWVLRYFLNGKRQHGAWSVA